MNKQPAGELGAGSKEVIKFQANPAPPPPERQGKDFGAVGEDKNTQYF